MSFSFSKPGCSATNRIFYLLSFFLPWLQVVSANLDAHVAFRNPYGFVPSDMIGMLPFQVRFLTSICFHDAISYWLLFTSYLLILGSSCGCNVYFVCVLLEVLLQARWGPDALTPRYICGVASFTCGICNVVCSIFSYQQIRSALLLPFSDKSNFISGSPDIQTVFFKNSSIGGFFG